MRHRALVARVRSFGNRPYQPLRYCLVGISYLPGYVGLPASGKKLAALCGGAGSAGFWVKRGTSLAGGMGWADVTL